MRVRGEARTSLYARLISHERQKPWLGLGLGLGRGLGLGLGIGIGLGLACMRRVLL